MIITTTDYIPGKEIDKIIGVVSGNSIRAKHIGKDIVAGLRTIVGGEISEYTEMLSESRREALQRMMEDANSVSADAVINIRYSTSAVMTGAAEMLAYGTAVKLK
ncbi:MAG: YbjQ family protein [Candidatus Methanofastidiosa archaeon]|nr:YbjQ family protein [Candidatus Methanofastidiosa archaeon]